MSRCFDKLATDRIDLERIRFQVSQAVDKNVFLQRMEVSADELSLLLTNQLVCRLTAEVMGREVRRQVVATRVVPADWQSAVLRAASNWLHLRFGGGRRLPMWARRRLFWLSRAVLGRVRTEEIETEVREYRVCPHIRLMFEEAPFVHLEWLKGEAPAIPGA